MNKTFVCSDESVNSYGFRVLTSGIDLAAFLKNPIMLWNHTRSGGGNAADVLPIGKWEGVQVKGGELVATAVFDETDPFAVKIAQKVKNGFISACSIGIRIIETDSNKKTWTQEQTAPTVTKCVLREISICDIPANGNAVAVALYDENDNLLDLSDVKALQTAPDAGLSEVERLRRKVESLEKEKEAALDAVLSDMVTEAVRKRKTTENRREMYMSVGRIMGVETLREVLADLSEPIRPSDIIRPSAALRDGGNQAGKPKYDWTLDDYRRNDPEALERDPYLFRRLCDAENNI